MIDWKATHITASAPPAFAGQRSDRIIMGVIADRAEFYIVRTEEGFKCTDGLNEDWFDTFTSSGEAKRSCEVRWNVKRYDALNTRSMK